MASVRLKRDVFGTMPIGQNVTAREVWGLLNRQALVTVRHALNALVEDGRIERSDRPFGKTQIQHLYLRRT